MTTPPITCVSAWTQQIRSNGTYKPGLYAGPCTIQALQAVFPLMSADEAEGEVVCAETGTAVVWWRTAARMSWGTLVTTLQAAAPDATGTLTVRYPYADDPSPVFLVFGPHGVSAHDGYWAMAPTPFRRWPAPAWIA
ncbi:MAG: hypothetical protein OWR62_12035 [Sulfobacillus thermotolerans]|nr:hypothetical protein [Sulfobacillus thermotolerans]